MITMEETKAMLISLGSQIMEPYDKQKMTSIIIRELNDIQQKLDKLLTKENKLEEL